MLEENFLHAYSEAQCAMGRIYRVRDDILVIGKTKYVTYLRQYVKVKLDHELNLEQQVNSRSCVTLLVGHRLLHSLGSIKRHHM